MLQNNVKSEKPFFASRKPVHTLNTYAIRKRQRLGKARAPGMVRGVARPPEVRNLEKLRAGLNDQIVVVMQKWFDFRLATFPAQHCRDPECRVLHSELFRNGPEMLFDADTGISYVRVE